MRRLATAALFLYPLWTHLAIRAGHPAWALSYMLALYAVLVVWWSGRQGAWLRMMFALLVPLPLLAVAGTRSLLFVPPVLVNLGLGLFFWQSLRLPGEALVSRLARLIRQAPLPPEQLRYTRWVTGIWAVFFFLMALESMLLALFAPLSLWSFFTNVMNNVFVVALFLVEYAYRRMRFPDQVHDNPWRAALSVARTWRASAQKRP